MEKRLQRLIKQSCAYGMGYVSGKHNLTLSKKEITKISNNALKEVKNILKALPRKSKQ